MAEVTRTERGRDPFAKRLGGKLGRHSRRAGVWFTPTPWVIATTCLVWLATMMRFHLCVQQPGRRVVNTFEAMCYSDISVFFRQNSFAFGAVPWRDFVTNQPPGVVAITLLTRSVAWLLSGKPVANEAPDQLIATTSTFYAINAVVLFACVLALAWAHLRLGSAVSDATQSAPRTSWQALFVVASPLIVLTGLINWDLAAVALTALALVAWSHRHPVLAGITLALAVTVRPYPLAVAFVIVLLALRARHARRVARALASFLASLFVTVAVTYLPVAIVSPASWLASWRKDSALGSLWYALELIGVNVPHRHWWSGLIALVVFVGVAIIVFVAPRRPRLGSLLFVTLAPITVFATGYSPQNSLWLCSLLVFAVPRLREWLIFTASEMLYGMTVWPFLTGSFGPASGNGLIYPVVTLWHIAVICWLVVVTLDTVWHPWRDPLRSGYSDDVLGGVFDHAVDMGRHGGDATQLNPGEIVSDK